MESAMPNGGRVEEVGGEVFHFGIRKAFAGNTNGGFRNVEGSGTEPPRGELLGIVAQTTANRQRRFSRGWLRMGLPKIKQVRIGAEIGPRDSALPGFALVVQLFEPSGRVALAIEFRS